MHLSILYLITFRARKLCLHRSSLNSLAHPTSSSASCSQPFFQKLAKTRQPMIL